MSKRDLLKSSIRALPSAGISSWDTAKASRDFRKSLNSSITARERYTRKRVSSRSGSVVHTRTARQEDYGRVHIYRSGTERAQRGLFYRGLRDPPIAQSGSIEPRGGTR